MNEGSRREKKTRKVHKATRCKIKVTRNLIKLKILVV